VDAEGNPTEDAETVARKRAVKAKMLAEFAEQSAAADAVQATCGCQPGVLPRAIHSWLRSDAICTCRSAASLSRDTPGQLSERRRGAPRLGRRYRARAMTRQLAPPEQRVRWQLGGMLKGDYRKHWALLLAVVADPAPLIAMAQEGVLIDERFRSESRAHYAALVAEGVL
jgi:hypothetical protein